MKGGIYYFRIKQVYSNGYVRYSNIKQVDTGKFRIDQNFLFILTLQHGIVGIKFDNSLSGHFNIQIYNTQGQMTVKKEIAVKQGSSYMELARLSAGSLLVKAYR